MQHNILTGYEIRAWPHLQGTPYFLTVATNIKLWDSILFKKVQYLHEQLRCSTTSKDRKLGYIERYVRLLDGNIVYIIK